MLRNLIGKYVRNWKHATVVCFTALSGKSPGGSEKNHNENPVMTVGLLAEIKMRRTFAFWYMIPCVLVYRNQVIPICMASRPKRQKFSSALP
jgi:hypothetical protein